MTHMSTCVCKCLLVVPCASMDIHIYTHAHTHACTHTHTQTYTHTDIYTHMHTQTYTHMHTHTYTHICTHRHTYRHSYRHIHTHAQIQSNTDRPTHRQTTNMHKHTYSSLKMLCMHLYIVQTVHVGKYTCLYGCPNSICVQMSTPADL